MMSCLVFAVATGSALALYYIYDGYGRLLSLLSPGSRQMDRYADTQWPSISIVVAAYNEQDHIQQKLDGLLAQHYPGPTPQIIVCNDGSEDRTREIVQSYASRGVVLLDTPGRVGKSLAQNQGVAAASGEILVLTDVDTHIAKGGLEALIAPFSNEHIGCTSSHLKFVSTQDVNANEEQSMYWRYELKLRRLETNLGMLATAAGALMAVRKDLWVDLPAEYGDDCVVPLDVALQNKLTVQVEDAHASVSFHQSVESELKARSRMTLRNWTGTLSRSALLSFTQHPRYAFALWSHKMLRWLSPVFVALLLLSTLAMIWTHGWIVPGILVAGGVIAGCIGLIAMRRGIRLPLLSQLGSFALANLGFADGLLKAFQQKRIRSYDNN